MNTNFVVKYLGYRTTSHLWGIKYTRNPVDDMVKQAKYQLTSDKTPLPLMKLQVTNDGIHVEPMPQNQNPSCPTGKFPIESISYGVQDIVYTRVFAMIVVKSKQSQQTNKLTTEDKPFRCHGFVCDSRETARKLTLELARAFEVYSKKVKGTEEEEAAGEVVSAGDASGINDSSVKKKKFTIDLRSPEEIRREDGAEDGELDFSEA